MTRSECPRRLAFGIIFGLLLLARYPGGNLFSQALPGNSEEWVSVGSFGTPLSNNDVISGPVFAVAVDPRDANIVYAGASEGGVWKTWDGGANWRQLTDFALVREVFDQKRKGTTWIGALAVVDAGALNTVYAGTSNLGVFRSTDAGDTWMPLGATPLQSGCKNHSMVLAAVNKIVVANENGTRVIYAATKSGLYGYREDGTDCWKQPVGGFPQGLNVIDLIVDPYRNVFYAAVMNQGIFKSSEPLGQPWQKLAGGLRPDQFGRIALAFGGRASTGTPEPIVYAGFEAFGPYRYRLFKTIDGGNFWVELPAPPDSGQQGFSSGPGTQLFWNNSIAVGPTSSDDVLIGQIGLWRAFDGGRKGGFNDYRNGCPQTQNSWFAIGCCLADKCANPYRQAMDLHADIHDIFFAPAGSFIPVPWQNQILYVATDGGVARGVVDSAGTVRWQQATLGLAIGEVVTIALDPRDSTVILSGQMHEGTIKAQTTTANSNLIVLGDGSETGVDAGQERAMYFSCNVGFGGNICRSVQNRVETIWPANSKVRFWSDPYRPGHLLRLTDDTGRIYRTQFANIADAAYLATPAAWDVVDPFGEKTGKTATIAFRSARLEQEPVYYLGTDTGQIWRGSRELGWKKLCECGGSVTGLGADLQVNERVYAVFDGTPLAGRIKELSLKPDGTWFVKDIATNFAPQLQVMSMTNVVVDPLVPPSEATTIYVGTDQGIYRGDRLRLQHGVARGGSEQTVFDWTWRRSPGVPNLKVTDIEVHQTLSLPYQTGIIRAGTWGRGVFELRRSLIHPPQTNLKGLDVSVMLLDAEAAPPPLNMKIAVIASGHKTLRSAPFQINSRRRTDVNAGSPGRSSHRRRLLQICGLGSRRKASRSRQ